MDGSYGWRKFPGRGMPIYFADEVPELSEYQGVPQLHTGMKKEEGLLIPTPEVSVVNDQAFYDRVYPEIYKQQPPQLIHVQPFVEEDVPDYEIDSDDEEWIANQTNLSPLKFEQMIERLEKSSGQAVVTLDEAKAIFREEEEEDIIIAVYDYWLDKRLKTQQPLVFSVKTENRVGLASNDPYLVFRRRMWKIHTRKNRKHEEASYEKMLKLRSDLNRTLTLLDMVKWREEAKREAVQLSIEIVEKRYQARDYSGTLFADVNADVQKDQSSFAPINVNHVEADGHDACDESSTDDFKQPLACEGEVDRYAFRPVENCQYRQGRPLGTSDPTEMDPRFRFAAAALHTSDGARFAGYVRPRIGRGGRFIMDRFSAPSRRPATKDNNSTVKEDDDDNWPCYSPTVSLRTREDDQADAASPPSLFGLSVLSFADDNAHSIFDPDDLEVTIDFSHTDQ